LHLNLYCSKIFWVFSLPQTYFQSAAPFESFFYNNLQKISINSWFVIAGNKAMAGFDIINCVPNMTIDDKELHFNFECVKITMKNDGLFKRGFIKWPGGVEKT
jgi:hypothetical protein